MVTARMGVDAVSHGIRHAGWKAARIDPYTDLSGKPASAMETQILRQDGPTLFIAELPTRYGVVQRKRPLRHLHHLQSWVFAAKKKKAPIMIYSPTTTISYGTIVWYRRCDRVLRIKLR